MNWCYASQPATPLGGRINVKLNQKKLWVGVAALILLLAAGGTYYQFVYRPAQVTASQPAVQTSVVRQGELVVSATGTGTLIPAKEYDLTFKASGMVTNILVKPGDTVKAGDLLAQVDDSDTQAKFTEAKLAYQELTSDAAIAAAQKSVATAESKLLSAKLQLEYLLSPGVTYWEGEVTQAQQNLTQAQAALDASPSDAALQQEVEKAKVYLDFAKDRLASAWVTYEKVYIFQTFPIREDARGNDYVLRPTDLEISIARADILQAQTDIQDATNLYNALTGQPVPDDATGPGLTALRNAKTALDSAQETLDGMHIVAPVDGLVTSVNISVGNTSGTSTAIVVADLSQAYLQIYMDASDWDKIVIGRLAQVTFDALPGKTFTGQVTQVDAELYSSGNTTSVRGLVRLDAPFSSIGLPLGIGASVDVVSAQVQNALLIPVETLHQTADGKYEVTVMVNGKPEAGAVEVGLQDLVSAQILSGLQAGDVVITSGS